MTSEPLLLCQHPRLSGAHVRVVLFAWAGWFLVFTSLMCFFWLAPLYRGELRIDDHDLKWIRGVALGASGLGGLLFGMLADRYGRRSGMLGSLIVTATAVSLLGYRQSREGLMVCGALLGFGVGGQWASGQMLLSETIPPARRRFLAAVAQSGAPFGLAAAAFLSFDWATDPNRGWRAVFFLLSSIGFLIPLGYFLIPESDAWQRMGRFVAPGRRARALLRPPIRPVFLLAFFLTLACQGNYWCTVTWLPEFMKGTWKLELSGSAHWTYVFAGASLAGYLLFAVVARGIGQRRAFVVFCGLMATGVAMITVFAEAIQHQPSLVLVFAAVAGVGTGLWSFFGPFYAEVFPPEVRATAAGTCMNVSRGFQLLTPVLVREVGGATLGAGVALAAIFAAVAAALVLVIPMRNRDEGLKESGAGPTARSPSPRPR